MCVFSRMLYVYSVAYRDHWLVVRPNRQLVVSPSIVCADSQPKQVLGSRVLVMLVPSWQLNGRETQTDCVIICSF